ncbi:MULTISPECIES: hypothetical protein [Rhizobium]|uniref:hypothetical protein n=1 Tax=Rhizobium TaxID=379 RepID=UPI001182AFFD|nr:MULTISPECIES: hypothetical protein [Rhizobium]MBY3116671.1 hypothetical protein [Rhizobium laguerreae]MBY3187889.1 hypothetical protein [Rhizobium laguerreae]
MAKSDQHVVWGPCCLCGKDIDAKSSDPLRLTAETSDGKWQVWFAHASCFKDKLVDPPDAPGFFDPAHF